MAIEFKLSYTGSEINEKLRKIDDLAEKTYVQEQIAAIPTPDVSGQINTHNAATDAHNDIRLLVDGLTTRLNTLANSDDTTLDQMSEVVAYITNNKTLIDGITTNKVNVADIIDNLTTNVSNKPLSAAQGVALKALIDAIVVPTKVSQLENDSKYLTTIPSEYITESELNAKKYLTSYTETDPTVPAWAKASTKPSYSASEVGADAAGTASSAVAAHNTATDAHADLREEINQLSSDVAELKEKDAPSYTNVIPISIDFDGTVLNASTTPGYATNSRPSASSNKFSSESGLNTTGLIACANNATIRMRNISTEQANADIGVHIFNMNDTDGNGVYWNTKYTYEYILGKADFKAVTDENGTIVEFTLPGWQANQTHIAICSKYIGADSIITVNEEIPEDTLEERVSNIEERLETLEKGEEPYTNQLPIAINADGSLYTATDAKGNITYGYKENYRINSAGEEAVYNGYYITGFIPVKKGDVLRFKELDYMNMEEVIQDHSAIKIAFYLSDFSFSTNMDHYPSAPPSDTWSPVFRDDGNVEQMTIPTASWYDDDICYMRLSAKKITGDSIITVNEEIPEDELEARVADLEARVEVLENGTSPEASDIPSYWQAALDEGVEAINTALCEAGRNKSAFLFYTDAHWNYGSQMSPKLLKYLYNHTGMAKTFFGGDIVNNEADDYDTMKYLWDWRNQLKDLPNHHSVVGNHDDGNTTDNLFNEKFVYGYLQAAEETSDIVRGEQGLYYYIDNPSEKTRYLFLDTAFQNIYYYDDQKEFVTNALLTTPDGWHIVAIAHIWYQTDYTANPPVPKEPSLGGAYLLEQFDNYNSRAGQFADCGGWVEFCIGGHTHWDFDATSATGIPIVLVETDSKHVRSGLGYTAGTTTEASVNGIVADYDANTIHVIRVGRGESRDIIVGVNVITYTNVLHTAIGFDGAVLNASTTPGYAANSRPSTSGNKFSTLTGAYTTGLIPCSPTATIRMRNISTEQANENNGVHIFNMNDTDGNGVYWNTKYTYEYILSKADFKAVTDENGTMIEFTLPGYQTNQTHIAICSQYIGADSIITINEEIDSNGGTTDEPDQPVTPDIPEVNYTNVLKTAIDTDGSLYNGGKGYKENYRLNSSGDEKEFANYYITGFIPVRTGDVVRMENMDYLKFDSGESQVKFVFYAEDFSYLIQMGHTQASPPSSAWSPVFREDGNVKQVSIPTSYSNTIRYMRICARLITDDSIITVNEEIG